MVIKPHQFYQPQNPQQDYWVKDGALGNAHNILHTNQNVKMDEKWIEDTCFCVLSMVGADPRNS